MFTTVNPPSSTARKGLIKSCARLQSLLDAIAEKEVNDNVLAKINQEIEVVNSASEEDEKAHKKASSKAYSRISKLVQKEHGYVVKGTQMAIWMSIGMGSFGTAIGVGIGLAMDNMGLLGLGFGSGMAIGLAIGAGLEEKAKKEGKLLVVKGASF